jgi:hypothetical protein
MALCSGIMEEYETIKYLIRMMPIAAIIISSLLLLKIKWPLRITIVFFIGWVAIFYSTQLFWDYSFNYAPTNEIQREVGLKDGGPRVGSLYFGWVYALIILLVTESILFIMRKIVKIVRPRKHKKANSADTPKARSAD